MTHLKFKNGTERLFNKAFSPFFSDVVLGGSLFDDSISRMPAVNISEDSTSFKVELAVPGMSKEDFKINLEKDVLTISSEKTAEKNEDGPKYSRKEFNFHSFRRSFNLPENADQENIQAEYTAGVLSLTISKKVEAAEPSKEIKIS